QKDRGKKLRLAFLRVTGGNEVGLEGIVSGGVIGTRSRRGRQSAQIASKVRLRRIEQQHAKMIEVDLPRGHNQLVALVQPEAIAPRRSILLIALQPNEAPAQ